EGVIPEAVHVLPLLAYQEATRLTRLLHVQNADGRNAVQRLRGGHAVAREAPLVTVRIRCHERLARTQGYVELLAKGVPGEPGKEHHHAEVHHITAVAAPVARDQPVEGGAHTLAVHPAPRTHTLVELLNDGALHE